LVNAKHLDIVSWASLARKPLLQLDHLHVLEANTGVDRAFDDSFGDVHAAADGSVVFWGHAVVFGQLVDLDLEWRLGADSTSARGRRGFGGEKKRTTYLAEFSDIANALSLQGAEIRGDAARLEIQDASEWLIEERSDGCDREATGCRLACISFSFV